MTATASNYIPAPRSVELHLSPSPEFSRYGYSKKVKTLGGRYSQCRGDAYRRYVTLPWTEEGRELANELVTKFSTGPKTTLIVRGDDSFRGRHVHAWVIVHKIDRGDADPCGSLLARYEFAFLRAFPDAVDPEPVAEAPQPDPDAVENVTLTVSLNQARTILAALSDRHDVLRDRFDEEARLGRLTAAARTEALLAEAKAAYQSIDRQAFQGAAQ